MKNLFRAAAMMVLLVPWMALADDDKPYSGVDAKTIEVLKKSSALYKDAKTLRTEAMIETTMTPDEGEKQEAKVKATIELQRPNMFALRAVLAKDEKAGPEVVCDGKNMFIHARKLKQYTEAKAPKDLDNMGRAIFPLQAQMTGMLFQNVLSKDPAEALLEGVTKGVHAGTEKVNGKEAHHLKFEQERLEWELWIASEGEPWVLKAKSVMELPNGKLTTVETYTNSKLNAEPTKDAFAFKAPEDAKKVKSLGRQQEDGDDK